MILDDNLQEEQEIVLSDKDIFTKIWTSPRKVFKYIHEHQYDKYVHLLIVLGAINQSLSRAEERGAGDDMSLVQVIILATLAGGLFGWISYYLYAALLSWTGKKLGGNADTTAMFRVFAYSMIPSVIALIIFIPAILVFGNELFKSEVVFEESLVKTITFWGTAILELILGIWGIVLLVIGISEAQKFSIGKSILNMILPIIGIILIVLLIGGFFYLIGTAAG